MDRLAWFLCGALAGAVGALLLAPASGKETREKLRQLVAEKFPQMTKEEIEKWVDEMMDKAAQESEDVDVEEC